MVDKTGIQWTDATWNPVTGCEAVSPGCDHCYAASLASGRLSKLPAYEGLAEDGRFNGTVRLLPERLDQPLRWTRPRMVFVNSMSDLFHKDIPDEYIARVWAAMAVAWRHTFQILTKRPGRMRSLLNRADWPDLVDLAIRDLMTSGRISQAEAANAPLLDGGWLPNVWLGVSAEDQRWADVRIPLLLETPAAVRFVSAEPLLGPIDFGGGECDHIRYSCAEVGCWGGLDWVIVGGESGAHARPMHPDWARAIRDSCRADGTAFLFKQWGEWRPLAGNECAQVGDDWPTGTHGLMCRRVGKHAAGRELDGRTWDEFPEAATT